MNRMIKEENAHELSLELRELTSLVPPSPPAGGGGGVTH
jgi:hypothetical protein